MSALGQKRTCAPHNARSALPLIATAKADMPQMVMSALPSKADMCDATRHVCFGPIADMRETFDGDKNLVVAKMNKPLTEIFPAIKFGDCTRAIFDALRHIFAISQPVLADPFGEPGHCFFVAMLVIKNQKPGHSRPLHQNMALNPRTGWRGIPTRDRSRAANDDPGADGKLR